MWKQQPWSHVSGQGFGNRSIHMLHQTLAGSFLAAHSGNWGCSKKPAPPDLASPSRASSKKRMSLDPMRHCCHCLGFRLGKPRGHVPDRSGGGSPSSKRAAVYVSHGGPPPIPQIWPDAICAIQNSSCCIAVALVAPCLGCRVDTTQ